MHITVKLVILASMFSDRVGKGERKGKGVCGFVFVLRAYERCHEICMINIIPWLSIITFSLLQNSVVFTYALTEI